MERIDYDFSGLNSAMFKLKSNPSSSNLNSIKYELNKFFTDSKCEEVIYTKNTDKLFFGMCCMPVMSDEEVVDVLMTNKPKRIEKYYIEIDSKLLDLGLSSQELTAVLLHEVGHLVNDCTPVEKTRNSIDMYLDKNKTNLSFKNSIHEKSLIKYAIKDSIRKLTSLFFYRDEEIIADEFVVRCGYGKHLESAYKTIVRSCGILTRGVHSDSKLATLEWTLRLYKDLGLKRVYAISVLNKARNITGSKLEKREIEIANKSLNKMEYLVAQEATVLMEKTKLGLGIFRDVRLNGLRNIEDDLYEFNIRLKNVSDEEESLLLLRQINLRLSIIEDYLSDTSLDEHEKKRWYKLFDKYTLLREQLSKKAIYSRKNYGLFVDYNTL